MPAVGEMAPDFELKKQDGETVKLSDYRGKKVVLFAYPKAFTSGCTTQARGFRDNFAKIETSNATVLGISPDEPEKLAEWIEAESLNYDLLSDPDHAVLDAWGAWGEKSMYGNTFEGVIRSHWIIGEDGTLLDEQIKISPKDSVAKALKFLGD